MQEYLLQNYIILMNLQKNGFKVRILSFYIDVQSIRVPQKNGFPGTGFSPCVSSPPHYHLMISVSEEFEYLQVEEYLRKYLPVLCLNQSKIFIYIYVHVFAELLKTRIFASF